MIPGADRRPPRPPAGKPAGAVVTLQELFIRRKAQKSLSDDMLMERLQHGDEGAFKVLYERYSNPIFIYCLRMMNDRDAAKDVLQDVFIRLHLRRENYEPGTNFGGWIHTIARNLCLNARRDNRMHASFDEKSYETGADGGSDVALRDRLASEIARLPELYREALILREYEDHSYDEIAGIIGAPMSTVKFRIFKAREMLRERLASSFDEYRGNSDDNSSID
jgi:RNA polymerase sigma-70 factor, ECF subfamily